MTLQELKQRFDENNLKYAYGVYKKAVEPPFFVAITRASDNFMADNVVYDKDIPIQLDYIYEDKDQATEILLEDEILKDIAWNKSDEAYLEDEKVFVVSYFFEI